MRRNLGFIFASLAVLIIPDEPANAQTTCSGWFRTCMTHCRLADKGASCSQYCLGARSDCMKNGCWVRAPKFGSHRHCSLSKQ
jgi:hypothetical protein